MEENEMQLIIAEKEKLLIEKEAELEALKNDNARLTSENAKAWASINNFKKKPEEKKLDLTQFKWGDQEENQVYGYYDKR